jgi:hypothetical protein
MPLVLKCTNEDCNEDTPQFSTNLIVDEKGKLEYSSTDIPGEEFECVFCHNEAEWEEESTQEEGVIIECLECTKTFPGTSDSPKECPHCGNADMEKTIVRVT